MSEPIEKQDGATRWVGPIAHVTAQLVVYDASAGYECQAGHVVELDRAPFRWHAGTAGTDHATFDEARKAEENEWKRRVAARDAKDTPVIRYKPHSALHRDYYCPGCNILVNDSGHCDTCKEKMRLANDVDCLA